MNGSLDNTGDMAEYRAPSRADIDATRLEALLASADLPASDPELLAALASVRSLADQPVPRPSPELAALLATAGRPGVRRLSPRWAAAGAGMVTAILIGAGGVAAATDNLPSPAQRVVSGVVSGLVPFEAPRTAPSRTPAQPASPIPARGGTAGETASSPGAGTATPCNSGTGRTAPCGPDAMPSPDPRASSDGRPGGSGESDDVRPDPWRTVDENGSQGRTGSAPSTSTSGSHEHDDWRPGSSPHGSSFASPSQSQSSGTPSPSPDPSQTSQPWGTS